MIFSLGADGDPTEGHFTRLKHPIAVLNADLTNAVGITWNGELLAEPAQLGVSVDLAKLPGAALTGKAGGVLRIEPQSGRPPVAHFRFSAEQVRARQWDAKTVLVRGEFAAHSQVRREFGRTLRWVGAGCQRFHFGQARRVLGGHCQLSGGFLHNSGRLS